jgi:ADP-heptose:LPS heptosyltransferase
VLLVTPALRALRAGYPRAALHAAVDAPLVPLLERNPHLDRVWVLPERGRKGSPPWHAFVRELRRARFDLVVDLHGSPRTALVARLSGARNRVGYALRGRGRLYNLRVPRDADRTGRRRPAYAARTNLEIVARLGVRHPALDDLSLVAPPEPGAEARMAAVLDRLAPGRPRIGLAPAGTWQAKTWPEASWAALVRSLFDAGTTPLLLWGPGEEPLAVRVQEGSARPVVRLPPTDLDELGAVLGRLDLLVATCSGVKHLAVARGTPTLTLWGPSSPLTWSPPAGPHAGLRVRLPCVGCNLTRCSHHLCMRLLHPDDVAARALELVRPRRDAGGPACGF